MAKKILVTSALPYVNNVPHLGNIVGSVLSADVFARFNRSIGNETLFIGGTDEHGTATETKALEEGLTPKQICDKYYKIHNEIYDWFNISFDIFGRTSDKEHVKVTQDIFLKLHKNGYISEDDVEQLFCEQGNHFLADRFVEGKCPYCGFEDARGDQCDSCGRLINPLELINPKCKIHDTTPTKKSSRHLFIDLQKLQPELEDWIKKASKEGSWTQNAITTTNGWLKEGLQKRAITRDLKWGVSVPLKGYEDKVFYVWFDAPIGYISITSRLTKDWKDWWNNPKDVRLYQFMAKDNIPFHTIVFPATLIGTKQDYTMLHHIDSTEYLQYESGKFSKSRNVGVFGDGAKNSGIPADAYRYYLMINRPENADTIFSWQDFADKINNELVANLGNLVNRVIMFINNYLDGKIEKSELTQVEIDFYDKIRAEQDNVTKHLEDVKIKQALKNIMKISQAGNQFFQEQQPWKTRNEDKEKCKRSMYVLANLVKDIAILTEPYLPDTSKDIFSQLGIEKRSWEDIGNINIEGKITGPKILFSKVDDKKIKELQETFSGKKDEVNFSILNLKIGKITSVKKHPDADKLYVEEIDLGDEKRQVVSGLVGYYLEDELIGKNVIVVTNLETAKLRGIKSEGMILAVEKGDEVGVLLAEGARPGDQVIVEGYDPGNKKIQYKDFQKVKMKVLGGVATYNGKPLMVSNKKVTADKLNEGKIC